ncbi:MAG: DNA helicase RecG, partial [Myxococcota bacterium]
LLGSKSATKRLKLLERTRDGIEIAEEDLRLRGMGDLTGKRQAGENAEGLENLADEDIDLLLAARDIAADRVRPPRSTSG